MCIFIYDLGFSYKHGKLFIVLLVLLSDIVGGENLSSNNQAMLLLPSTDITHYGFIISA